MLIWVYVIGAAVLVGIVVGLLVDLVSRRLRWWSTALPPSTKPAIARDRKARRLHIARSWVGRRSPDDEGGVDVLSDLGTARHHHVFERPDPDAGRHERDVAMTAAAIAGLERISKETA